MFEAILKRNWSIACMQIDQQTIRIHAIGKLHQVALSGSASSRSETSSCICSLKTFNDLLKPSNDSDGSLTMHEITMPALYHCLKRFVQFATVNSFVRWVSKSLQPINPHCTQQHNFFAVWELVTLPYRLPSIPSQQLSTSRNHQFKLSPTTIHQTRFSIGPANAFLMELKSNKTDRQTFSIFCHTIAVDKTKFDCISGFFLIQFRVWFYMLAASCMSMFVKRDVAATRKCANIRNVDTETIELDVVSET